MTMLTHTVTTLAVRAALALGRVFRSRRGLALLIALAVMAVTLFLTDGTVLACVTDDC